MKFQKINLTKSICKDKTPKWFLILETVEDINKYFQHEEEISINSLLSLPKAQEFRHLTTRETVYSLMVQTLNEVTAENIAKAFYNLHDQRINGMLEIIKNGDKVLIQPNGLSNCEYSGFMSLWGGEVIDEIIKDSIYIPNETELPDYTYVFLENDETISRDLDTKVNKYFDRTIQNVKIINNLKAQDPDFILRTVKNAKYIIFESYFVNKQQIDSMFKLFSNLTDKTFLILTKNKSGLENHSNYKHLLSKNTVIFL